MNKISKLCLMKNLFYNQKTVSRQLNRECLSPDSITSVRFLSKTSETKTWLSFRSHLVSLSERGIHLFILSTFDTSCTSFLRALFAYPYKLGTLKMDSHVPLKSCHHHCFHITDFLTNEYRPCVVSSLLSDERKNS